MYLSTVSTLTYSDWSIAPPVTTSPKTTIEVRRELDELGSSLWVYEIILGSDGEVLNRHPLREVTWFFAEEEGWEVTVSAMAARPAKEGDILGETNLTVEFDKVVVEVKA